MPAQAVDTNPRGDLAWQEETSLMCQPIQCNQCGKPTWTGCGRHIEQALAGVPPQKRCSCPPPKSFIERLLGGKG